MSLDHSPPIQQVFELTRMHHLFEIVRKKGPEIGEDPREQDERAVTS